jgi:hypothetical protein
MEFRTATDEDFEQAAKKGLSGGKYLEPGEVTYHAVALIEDEELVGIGGFQKITDTTAWAWVELTPQTFDNIYVFYRTVRDWIHGWKENDGTHHPGMCERHHIYRLQAWVDVENKKAERFCEHLGFSKEYRMKDFLGKGKDAFMYVQYMEY